MKSKIYLCIDLKCFYASVECVERGLDPFKTDLIVADVARSKNTICLAISPLMKERGIKNRCRYKEIPETIKPVIAKPRMLLYMRYSARIHNIFLKYVSKEDIHQYSIDEAFLDITSYLKLYKKTPKELAKEIMDEIYKETKISSRAGIGTNLYLTKIALDIMAKHNKDHVAFLNEDLYKKYLWHYTPLTEFWMISTGTYNRLKELGIKDMYDIANYDEKVLYKVFGIRAELLIDHSKGIEPCTIKDIKEYTPKSRSISNSQILFRNYNKYEVKTILIEMLNNLSQQLVREKFYAKYFSFYIGYSKNIEKSLSKSIKLENSTNNYSIISRNLLKLYEENIKDYPIRRVGVSASFLETNPKEQLNLFSNNSIKEEDLYKTMNEINNKYGKNSLMKAASYKKEATMRERNKLIGGHNAY